MLAESRRRFLIQSGRLGAAALAANWISRHAFANPMGRPVGIQLYTVNTPMQEDAAGTLKQLRDIGFAEVESAGFGKRSAKQFRKLLDDAGLVCPSAHLHSTSTISAHLSRMRTRWEQPMPPADRW